MEVTLKIRRSPDGASHTTETYTVDVPETATLLDALDAVKDKRDGTLAYRKSCRMAVCGSCGMRMDGGAVLACKTAMKPLVEAGHVPTISPISDLPNCLLRKEIGAFGLRGCPHDLNEISDSHEKA